MSVHLGAGWYLYHVTDRVIELRKDDATYRRITGRDGFVRFRGEPGMDRQALIDGAVEMAKANDARVSELAALDVLPSNVRRYRVRQHGLAQVFGTGEESSIIGVRRA